MKENRKSISGFNLPARDIYESLPGGILWCTTEGEPEIIFCNQKAALCLEEEKQTLEEGANLLSFVCPEDRERLGQKIYHCCRRKDEEESLQLRFMGAAGTERWMAASFKLLSVDQGCVVQIYLTDMANAIEARDREKRQRERAQLEVYYQTLIKHLPGGIAVTIYRNGSLYPEFFSEGFVAMMGMTQEKAFSFFKMGVETRIHLNERDGALRTLFKNIEKKSDSWESVYRLQRGDGDYIWVRNISSLITEPDGTLKVYAICSDVSQEMKNQQELRQKYNDMLFNHYKSVAPNEIISGHCNVTKDRIIDITDTTRNHLLETFGYQRNNFFKGIADFIVDKKERQQFLDQYLTTPMARAFEREETKVEMECFVKLPNEKRGRYVRIIVMLISSPETGDVMGFLSLLDITEIKISNELFLRLAKESYDFIADVDMMADRYKLISVNRDTGSPFQEEGCFTQEAMELLYTEVLPKDRQICKAMLDYQYVKAQLNQKNSYSFHYSIEDRDGNIKTKNMLVFSIDKKLERVCLARVDVTESVREQQGLLNMLAYTFELAGFLDVETDGFVMYTRESVLRNLSPYYSRSFSSLIKKVVDRYSLPEEMEEMSRQLRKKVMLQRLAEQPEGYDLTFKFREGDKVMHKQYNILWSDDTHKTICLVRADVTDVLDREQQSKEELKTALTIAQEANRAKSDFLSSMSHDIRTPMNAIIGMTDLAIANRQDAKQIDESLTVIKSSSEHLLRLINDILDMSRIESGRMVLAKEPFNQKKEMDKLANRCKALAEKKHLHFEYKLDIRHNDCIGDLLRVTKVLENLLGNAIKFTPEGGTVSLQITENTKKGGKAIGWYQYVVSDNGIGIDAESIEHIFEPFYRTESSMISRTEGSGLGLSIVKNIVDYKGGTIDIESQPGKGATFYVNLPIHFAVEPAETSEGEQKVVNADLSGISVLLVEDNAMNQLIAVRILENVGAKVTVAANGEEGAMAFESSEAGTFDIILMDIQMPVMNGYDSVRTIRRSNHPQARTIPVVAMTANVFASDIKKCLDAGMDAHIAKPIDLNKLYGVVNEYWEKRKNK